jgi:hypothetical protein
MHRCQGRPTILPADGIGHKLRSALSKLPRHRPPTPEQLDHIETLLSATSGAGGAA